MSGSGSRDLGERFRAAREARGLTISDAAERIRIRSVYLAAIEDEHWNTIGAPVYARGFMRTYARFLGIDPEEAVAEFNRTQDVVPAATADVREVPRQRRWPTGALIWVAGTVAVILIAFVVYNEVALRSQEPSTAAAAATPTAAATATPGPATAAPAIGGANSLALVLSAPSWLRVTVDGSVSMEGTYPAGTAKTFHGKKALVRIGNAGGVEVYVDGKDRGKLGAAGDVVEQGFTL